MAVSDQDRVPVFYRLFALVVIVVDMIQAVFHMFVVYNLMFRTDEAAPNSRVDLEWYMILFHEGRYPIYDPEYSTDFWASVLLTLLQAALLVFGLVRMFQAACQNHSWAQWTQLTLSWQIAEVLFLAVEILLCVFVHLKFYLASKIFPWTICAHVMSVVMMYYISRKVRQCCCHV